MLSDDEKIALQENGFCILPDVLDAPALAHARESLTLAAAESRRRSMPTYISDLDPNDANVRVFNLLDLDPLFAKLIAHPAAIGAVRWLLEDDFIISNFTANTAKPGSGSMAVHSDLAIVIPEPWHAPWSVNAIWCLDDVYADNGATLYLPGSHHFQRRSELPEDPKQAMVPFEAEAGSLIIMEGRLWHTSGENRTEDQDRALLFGYYVRSFIRPQWNFNVGLSETTKAQLSPELRRWLGLGLTANVKTLGGID
ncbi:MAG: phytanoyl-CoA dioxygenase family protein [Gammaproteobacteria bacterium]|jgi:ectoine hydroxylase-related dioxygenase (phytanoyl-CoA dioxygenase family)